MLEGMHRIQLAMVWPFLTAAFSTLSSESSTCCTCLLVVTGMKYLDCHTVIAPPRFPAKASIPQSPGLAATDRTFGVVAAAS